MFFFFRSETRNRRMPSVFTTILPTLLSRWLEMPLSVLLCVLDLCFFTVNNTTTNTTNSSSPSATIDITKASTMTDRLDAVNVDELLKNTRLFNSYVNCMLESGPCTAEGREMKRKFENQFYRIRLIDLRKIKHFAEIRNDNGAFFGTRTKLLKMELRSIYDLRIRWWEYFQRNFVIDTPSRFWIFNFCETKLNEKKGRIGVADSYFLNIRELVKLSQNDKNVFKFYKISEFYFEHFHWRCPPTTGKTVSNFILFAN